MSRAYPRVTAIHEAGHAVVAARLGASITAVHLRTEAELRRGDLIVYERGRTLHARGAVEGGHHYNPGWSRITGRSAIAPSFSAIIADIATCVAGPAAEARFSRRAFVEVALTGGASDMADVADFVWLHDEYAPNNADSEGLRRQGVQLGRQLVREYWHMISAVADLVQGCRYTDGERVHDLLDRLGLPTWCQYSGDPLPTRSAS